MNRTGVSMMAGLLCGLTFGLIGLAFQTDDLRARVKALESRPPVPAPIEITMIRKDPVRPPLPDPIREPFILAPEGSDLRARQVRHMQVDQKTLDHLIRSGMGL